MGSNFAWMLILAKYLGLSRRFSNFGLGAEIWGTPRGAPRGPKISKNFFLQNFNFLTEMVPTKFVLIELSITNFHYLLL